MLSFMSLCPHGLHQERAPVERPFRQDEHHGNVAP